MADEKTAPELSPERIARRAEIKRLTKVGKKLFSDLKANSDRRNELILEELEAVPSVPGREIAELADLTVARVYALRDKAKKARKG